MNHDPRLDTALKLIKRMQKQKTFDEHAQRELSELHSILAEIREEQLE